jgi:protein involved in polysaccharide export with SLBB domain
MKSGLLIVAFVVVLSGCLGSKRAGSTVPQFSAVPSHADSERPNSTNNSPATNVSGNAESDGVIRAGNLLLITFTNLASGPALPAFDQQVRNDGTITLIYNQTFQTAGKKTGDLEKEIRDYYVPKYFIDLAVSVRSSSETSFVFVSGDFRKPGRYSWTNEMTLKDAIDGAGGFTQFANRRIWLRHLDGTVERYRLRGDWFLTNNPALKPGDKVINPREI